MATPDIDPEKLARYLEQNQDYRVLRRLKPMAGGTPAAEPVKVLVVDTESTGLSPDEDRIIDLGMVALEVDAKTGVFSRVLSEFSQLEDPQRPIPPFITKLTGITDADVRGKKIDDAAVTEFVANAELVIAHNASHDRPFMEKRFPIFEKLPWACSHVEIDWAGNGFGSSKLDYLAYRMGIFFEGHRALVDSQALTAVICGSKLSEEQTALQELIHMSLQSEYRVLAVGAPFEAKDALKARGYRWDGEERVWHITLRQDPAYDDEMAWLKTNIFQHKPTKLMVETRDAYIKHSGRRLKPEWKALGAQGDGSGGARRY
jgi:DNA polymerase-3 subunit epsilon